MFGVRFIQTTGRCTSTFVLLLQSFGMSRWQSSLWLFCHCRLCDIRVCYNATSEQRSRHAAVAIGRMLAMTLSGYEWLWPLRFVECCLWRYPDMSGYDICDWSNVAYEVIQIWVAMTSTIGQMLPITLSRYKWLWHLRLVECCLWRYPDMSGYDLSPPTSSDCLRYERLKLQRKYYITAWACSSKHTHQPTSHHVFEAQRECVCRQTDVWISRLSGH